MHQEAREDDGDGADAVGMEGGNHAEARARKPAKGGPLRHEPLASRCRTQQVRLEGPEK